MEKAPPLDIQREIGLLKEQLRKYEEDEASVCPEDVGFVEYIKTLEKCVDGLMKIRTVSEDNMWTVRENGHYGFDLFHGDNGLLRMNGKAYAQLVEYMSSFAMKDESRNMGGE